MHFYKVTTDTYIRLDRINYFKVEGFRCHPDAVHRYEVKIYFIDDVLTVYLTREEWVAFQKAVMEFA